MRLPLIPPAELAPSSVRFTTICARASRRTSRASRRSPRMARCRPLESLAACAEIRQTDLGPDLGAVVSPSLPRTVREVAILVTGTTFHSAYEFYAHVIAGDPRGLSDDALATIVAGQRPADLTHDQAVAYDVASGVAQPRHLARNRSIAKRYRHSARPGQPN